jgi:hypothetical protein
LKLKSLTLALALASFAAGASAQAAASAPAVSSPAKQALVQRVLKVQQPAIEALARNIAAQTSTQVLQTAGQAMGRVPADKRQAVAKDIEADVHKFYDETEALLRDRAVKLSPATIGPLLEERFSEDELKQIATWLESPVARKYAQLGPDMESALGQKLVTETRPAIEPKLKALEQTLAKRLGMPAAGAAAPASAPPAASAPKKK